MKGGEYDLLNEIILPRTRCQILTRSRLGQDTMPAWVRGGLGPGPDGPGSPELLSFICPWHGSGGAEIKSDIQPST